MFLSTGFIQLVWIFPRPDGVMWISSLLAHVLSQHSEFVKVVCNFPLWHIASQKGTMIVMFSYFIHSFTTLNSPCCIRNDVFVIYLLWRGQNLNLVLRIGSEKNSRELTFWLMKVLYASVTNLKWSKSGKSSSSIKSGW